MILLLCIYLLHLHLIAFFAFVEPKFSRSLAGSGCSPSTVGKPFFCQLDLVAKIEGFDFGA